MKDARDIRLLGIGFVAGMVLCYFLALDEPAPSGSATLTLAQAAPVSPVTNQLVPAQLPFGSEQGKSPPMWLEQPTLRKYGHPLLDMREAPDYKRNEPMRIVPGQKLNNQFPGVPVQYDLIDLDYKPDFKLPD